MQLQTKVLITCASLLINLLFLLFLGIIDLRTPRFLLHSQPQCILIDEEPAQPQIPSSQTILAPPQNKPEEPQWVATQKGSSGGSRFHPTLFDALEKQQESQEEALPDPLTPQSFGSHVPQDQLPHENPSEIEQSNEEHDVEPALEQTMPQPPFTTMLRSINRQLGTKKPSQQLMNKAEQNPRQQGLTLTELAQGYVNLHSRNPQSSAKKSGMGSLFGNGPVTMLSNKYGPVSGEQIRLSHYLQKIEQCFAKEFLIHKQETMRIAAIKPSGERVDFRFSLARNGALQSCYLTKSCGVHEVDEFIIHIFQQASVSFPPVPSTIPLEYVDLTFVIGL